MALELRSPKNERAALLIPDEAANLKKPYSGSICSQDGDEYSIKNNIVDILGKNPGFISLAQSSNHWNITASLYEDVWRKRSLSLLSGEDFPVQKEHELLIDWMAPKDGGLYLDLGCSTALYGRALKAAEQKTKIVALDFSLEMLEEARLKAEADCTNLFLVRADARELPFFSKTFDGIAMGGTLNELSEELKALYEARRVIKENGTFFVMHLIKSSVWYGRLLQTTIGIGGLKFWTVDESNTLFKQAGFRVSDQMVKGMVCFTKLIPA